MQDASMFSTSEYGCMSLTIFHLGSYSLRRDDLISKVILMNNVDEVMNVM